MFGTLLETLRSVASYPPPPFFVSRQAEKLESSLVTAVVQEAHFQNRVHSRAVYEAEVSMARDERIRRAKEARLARAKYDELKQVSGSQWL